MASEFMSLVRRFEIQAALTPDHVAASCETDTITYKELDKRSSQIAHYLISGSAGQALRVALYMGRSIEFVVAVIGVLKAGGAYVPIDSSMPPERSNSILNDCSPHAVITMAGFGQNLITDAVVINIDADWSLIGRQPVDSPDVSVQADDMLCVAYTAGLTGRPKAVQSTYRGIVNHLDWVWEEYPYNDGELACQRISVSVVGHIVELFSPLLKGVTLVILSDIQAGSALELVKIVAAKSITRITLTPSLLKSVLSVSSEQMFHLSGLKYVFCSGEALSAPVARLFYQRFKHAHLINIYGATEVGAGVTWHEVKRLHIDHALAHFSKSVESLPDHDPGGMPSPGDRRGHEITTPDMPVNELASRFMNTGMADHPLGMTEYFEWFKNEVMPYSINTASPLYIGHMTSALPDFVHDVSRLISRMNQNLVKIETAKSAIFLEREAIAMLHRCFYGLPDPFYKEHVQKVNANLGLVTTGGTVSNITALMIARNRALARLSGNDDLSAAGLYRILQASGYKDMVLIGSDLMHYSIKKSASVLGMGAGNIINVASTSDGAMDIRDLHEKIDYCRENKLYIFAITGIAGATETGHIDPLQQMADIARQYDIYFHVDAAWGGGGVFSDTYRNRFRGIECADSITFCAHKQLYLPQGISLCLFRDPEMLRYGATTAAYQSTPDSYDVGRFSMEGSRSDMALLIHLSLQVMGKKGYEALFDASVEKSVLFARIIDSMDCFELIFEPPLNIVNYRYIPEKYRDKLVHDTLSGDDHSEINAVNQRLQNAQFIKGSTFVSSTVLSNTRYGATQPVVVFRAILANPLTTRMDIFRVLADQLMLANRICGDHNNHELHGRGEGMPSLADAFANNMLLQEESGDAFIPIGKPLPGCRIYLLDEDMKPVPNGQVGEIHVGGDAVSPGYFHRQKAYPDRFIKDPFSSDANARLFRTGDRGRRRASGDVEYIGRSDDFIKIGECHVELSGVESILLEIDLIKHCAITTEVDGGMDKYLVAHIELVNKEAESRQLDSIKSTAAKKLLESMLPRKYRILDEMPFTLSGKIDRNKLKKGKHCIAA